MRKRGTNVGLSVASLLLAAGASAAPMLIITPAAEDISADGQKTLGRLVEWTNSATDPDYAYVPHIWQRGGGFTRVPGAYRHPEMVRGSADFTNLVSNLENTSNWGNLNCFAGYCFGSMTGCTPGEPLPDLNNCWVPSISHWYSASTGWVNSGSFDRLLDAGTGRWYGGTRCDGTINSPYDISGNGRYIVGGAYSAPLFTSSGGPGFGLCGSFYAFRYDSLTGEFEALPSASGSNTTRADHVNFDGTVVSGYDLGEVINGEDVYVSRRPCVWTNGVQTILDNISGTSATFPVNSTGNTIAGEGSSQFSLQTFGTAGIKLVRWVRNPDNTWTPQNLGRPVNRFGDVSIDVLVKLYPSAISADGNTIVGTAVYNQEGPGGTYRPFIWRPSINGGVPIDLQDYLAQTSPGNPIDDAAFVAQFVRGMSDDGNALLMEFADWRNTCTNGAQSHVTFATGVLYLDGTGIACEPPQIAKGPVDWTATDPYYYLGVAMNVAASGSGPLSYQWQREDPFNPGTWTNLTDECSNFPTFGGYTGFSATFNYEGTTTTQLRIGMDDVNICGRAGLYRVVVSNACGSVTSEPAEMFVGPMPIFQQPTDITICGLEPGTVELQYTNFGDPPNYQWQIESAPDVWDDLTFGTYNLSCGGQVIVIDPYAEAMEMTVLACTGGSEFRVRCSITSGCRAAISDAVIVTAHEEGNCGGNPCPPCAADYDQNGGVDGGDLAAFFTDFETGETCADVDQNGGVDGGDLGYFFQVFEAGGC